MGPDFGVERIGRLQVDILMSNTHFSEEVGSGCQTEVIPPLTPRYLLSLKEMGFFEAGMSQLVNNPDGFVFSQSAVVGFLQRSPNRIQILSDLGLLGCF